MADFISSLNGVQMDSALMDMAEHTSEAYAIGERNGVPVDSSDVAYHNNARYYAQQAQSIAPASVTEAVRWDVAQTGLTDANRLQARENIKATSHNYNFLDNSWFTINSRNITTGTGTTANSYLVDRWNYSYGSGGISWTWNANGMTFAPQNTSSHALLKQKLLSDAPLDGKKVTGSVMLQDGTIHSGTIDYVASNPSAQYFFSVSLSGGVSFRFFIDNATKYVVMDADYGSVSVRAAKVEIGSFSTLANDAPPDYGEELTRCIYSTADPADTYANNGYGRSNPNLIDNPWFTIQQRGASAFTSGYSADRWQKQNSAGSVTPTANGLQLALNGTDAIDIRQYFTLNDFAVSGNNKPFTFSMLMSDGTLFHEKFIMKSSSLDANVYFTYNNKTIRCNFYTTSTTLAIRLVVYTDCTIRAVKLEQGTVSTLANDTPPDYATELAKCRYYFRRYKNGAGSAVNTLIGGVAISTVSDYILDGEMRNASGTTTYSGSITVNGQAATGVTSYNRSGQVTLRINATSLTPYQVAIAAFATDAYIDISHDL